MHLFTYKYKGETHNSVALAYMEGGFCRYRVTLSENIWLTITTVEIPGSKIPIFWEQLQKREEILQPDELVQALGQGLYNAGIAKSLF